MYVRSTVIDGDPRRVDDAITYVRDTVVPFVAGLDGSLGASMLVSRSMGRTITSTAWRSAEAMADSLDALAAIRTEGARIMGGQAVPEQWTVAERDRVRAPEVGFANRSTRLAFAPADADLLVDTYRSSTIPSLSLLAGYCGAVLLIDRDRGQAVSSVTFDTRTRLEDSRRTAAEIRRTSVEKAHAKVMEIVECEIAVAGISMEWPA